jgi:hypothetical protein
MWVASLRTAMMTETSIIRKFEDLGMPGLKEVLNG